jgi:hypothetical protein
MLPYALILDLLAVIQRNPIVQLGHDFLLLGGRFQIAIVSRSVSQSSYKSKNSQFSSKFVNL